MKKKGPIIAAGGVITRAKFESEEILICHRPDYDDWCLPKGKKRKDESIEQCAVREITEETGNVPLLVEFIGHTEYRSKSRRKVVYWWLAKRTSGKTLPLAKDVDRTRWVSLEVARALVRKKDRPVLEWISENLR